jgi:predicted  nucleic acid-binding Zn-ribbon protein
MTVITKEFISIFEEMVRGDRPCPNTTIQYYVDQVRKLRAEHDNLVKRTTDLNSELDSIKTKLIRIEAAADKYVEDIAWSMKKVEDADAADVMKTIAEITRKNVRAMKKL